MSAAAAAGETGSDRLQRRIVLRGEFRGYGANLGDHFARHGAAVAGGLAADQIVGLDAGGAFVDRGDAGIAKMLGGAGFLDVAHAAMHLQAERRDFLAQFGGAALDDGNHQVDERLMPLARLGIGIAVGVVHGGGGDVGHGTYRLGIGAHRHQHPADVGVIDDHAGRGLRRDARGPALHAISRIGHRPLIGALRNADAFHADGESGQVHHDEHVFEAAILLAHHVTDRAALVAVGHDRGGARMNAELVLERHARDVVARARATRRR